MSLKLPSITQECPTRMVGQGAQRHGRRLGSGSGNGDTVYRQLIEHLNERIGCGALWYPDISETEKQAGNRNSPASPPPSSPDERSEYGSSANMNLSNIICHFEKDMVYYVYGKKEV